MYWPGVCAVEMKAFDQADKLPDHREPPDYWLSLDDPPSVVLCNFQQFVVWKRDRFKFAPPANFSLADLPDNYEKLIFLAGTDQASRKSLFLKWRRSSPRWACLRSGCICCGVSGTADQSPRPSPALAARHVSRPPWRPPASGSNRRGVS